MFRLIWIPALVLAACGVETDRRPRTVEYITEAILTPNCANAQCHSSFRQELGYDFGTVERAKPNLVDLVGPITLDANGEPVGQTGDADTRLMNAMTRTQKRMPYDEGLPDVDLELIRAWIERGAEGAQCNPKVGERVCIGNKVYECKPTFDYGGLVEDCGAKTCGAGVCR